MSITRTIVTRKPLTVALLAGSVMAAVPAVTRPAAAMQDTASRSAPAAPDTATKLPLKAGRKIAFSTDEATWVSLDVSPDGQTIIYDILGDLYSLPISGGKAKRLTSGMSWDCMPRFSPDGKLVAFISDRSGSDNLWVMNPDGTGLRPVTRETDNTVSSPAWTPDGEYLVVRRFGPYPTRENYLTNVPLWMYHKDVGTGFEIFPRKPNTPTTNSGAAFSPDGRTMYFSSHPGGFTGAEVGRYQVMELDRKTGESRAITSGYGGGLRPVVSPDGHWLVYATRRDAETALRVRDLKTLKEEWLVASMQRDDQEGYAPNDVLPGYGFTPDSRAVVFTADGKIKRVDVATKHVSVIPFTADVEQELATLLKHEQRIDDGPLAVRELMWVNQSPDGRRATFTGAGKVWTTDLPGSGGIVQAGAAASAGSPRRLTSSAQREYAPAISPDGRWIALVSHSDSNGSQIVKVPSAGGAAVAITPAGGQYSSITWGPDGDKIVYQGRRFAPPDCRGCASPELAWVSADGGEPHRILMSGGNSPSVVKTADDGERVYYLESQPAAAAPAAAFSGPPPMGLVSVKLDGSDKRTHAKITSGAGQLALATAKVSPDGKWLLLIDRDDAYVVELADVGNGIDLNLTTPVLPGKRVTNEGANFVGWADNGKTITWSFANSFYRVPLDRVIHSARREDWRPERFDISLSVPKGIPQGTVVFRNARVVTMKGGTDEVIEHGDIVVKNNRIEQVGASGKVTIPAGARVIDAAGKTIIPGLVDVHAHPQTGTEMPDEAEWNIANHLAYGVTTTRNPSGNRMTFSWNELVETGDLVGPRLYGTATPLTTTTIPITRYEDALHAVRRYKQQGANSLKQYLQPRRIQRQWIRMAADSEQMNATNEGASDFKADLTMALDGYTGIEHSLNVVPLYKDVVQLIAQSKSTYTPTLIVAYGGPEGELYWRDHTDMHADDKIRRFVPHEEIDRKWRRHQTIIAEDFIFPKIAAGVRDIVRAGGRTGLGSHGNQQGIGAQWELRMLQSGGLTPHEVLRTATIYGAESIGFARDLGSIEAGKLADLVVLDANPLVDINNAAKIKYVVKGGVVYDAATLDEIWPVAKKFPLFPWRVEDEAYDAMKKRVAP